MVFYYCVKAWLFVICHKSQLMIKTSRLLKLFRFLLFIFAFMLYMLLLQSCSKGNSSTDTTNGPPGTGCSTTLAQAESIDIFPAGSHWRKDISQSALEPASTQLLAGFASNGLKADFGSGLWNNAPIGIPYVVVCSSQPKINVLYRANGYDGNYGDESDLGPFPIPLNAPVEGNGAGDSHVIAVDAEGKKIYELYNASVNNGRWEASSGAVFDLQSASLRPDGWTSADAAGLPIFPGLVRYEEILQGEIDHPIRFTLNSSQVKAAHVAPARHHVNSSGGQSGLPFGARIRLRADFDISGFSAINQVILRALKKYGLILADIGSNLYISGAPDARWNNDDLRRLGQVKGSDFEVVQFTVN